MEIVSINSSTKIYSILEEVITYLSERELYQPTFFYKNVNPTINENIERCSEQTKENE